jgi:colanic acid/amylovoran biosynthesis glycosyltransferase
VLTIAYLANQFPSPVEPYVGEEIEELRSRGVRVITGSVRKVAHSSESPPDVVLQWPGLSLLMQALWLCLREWKQISPLIMRIVFGRNETPLQQVKALVHTWLGACYAVRLDGRGVDHIHVHHGYFGSWIGMVAARLLGLEFSMTLHGSDLLLQRAYLDVKLENCAFCFTVSEYNRRYILKHYPEIDPQKVVVSRLGVALAPHVRGFAPRAEARRSEFSLLAVGRLHPVKDHAFLLRACAQLQQRGVNFECSVAGTGPERRHLESLIRRLGLDSRVTLLGHVERNQMDSLYERADVVVLTSRSEGIPLVLMEAMARRKIVLAPDITGIPELVIAGTTGFLYAAGSMEDFVDRMLFIHSLIQAEHAAECRRSDVHSFLLSAARQLEWVRHGARLQVHHNFNRRTNLKSFGDLFVSRIAARRESLPNEDFVLQQI